MKPILIKTLLAVLLVAGACPHAACKASGNSPGAVSRRDNCPTRCGGSWCGTLPIRTSLPTANDRSFYYVCDEAGGYYLLSGDGAIRGFRFRMRQPSRQILDLLPEAAVAYIRESYPGYFLGAFLPEDGGYRAELFGEDDRTLRFDGEGRFLREE